MDTSQQLLIGQISLGLLAVYIISVNVVSYTLFFLNPTECFIDSPYTERYPEDETD